MTRTIEFSLTAKNDGVACEAKGSQTVMHSTLDDAFDRSFLVRQQFTDEELAVDAQGRLLGFQRTFNYYSVEARDLLRYHQWECLRGEPDVFRYQFEFVKASPDGTFEGNVSPHSKAGTEFLESVDPDCDLQQILPAGSVKRGDTWQVAIRPGDGLPIFFLGGCLPTEVEGQNLFIPLDRDALDHLRGEAHCVLDKIDPEGGFARIAVDGRLSSKAKGEGWRWVAGDLGSSAGDFMEMCIDLEISGEYIWDFKNDILFRAEFGGGIVIDEEVTGEAYLIRGAVAPCYRFTSRWVGKWSSVLRTSLE